MASFLSTTIHCHITEN